MKFTSTKSLFLRSIAAAALEHPPPQAISVLISNFSSSSAQFTSPKRDSRGVKVKVWWDFENCNLPTGTNVFKIPQYITSAVRINGINGPITITAFGNILQLSRANQEALFQTGINLIHVPQGGKNNADRSLIISLMCWVTQNPPPAHLFLISSDRDFSTILHKLRLRNYNILLAGNEETTHGALCSAASIMWDWYDLVRGRYLTGKRFNRPPDSWYGCDYRTPLVDPFGVESCFSSKVVKEIGLVLRLYPKGVKIRDLRKVLKKRNVVLDKDFYGHKSFLRFLLSLPEVLKVVPFGDGMFLVHSVNNKESISTEQSSEKKNHEVSMEKMDQKNVKEVESQSEQSCQESVLAINVKDAKEEESQSLESAQESVVAISKKEDVEAKQEPVIDALSKEKDGFFNRLNRLWFGSVEIEREHLQEDKQISRNGDEWKGDVNEGRVVVDKDLESRIVSSTFSEVGNVESSSRGLLNRVLKRFEFFWGRNNTELSNEAAEVVDGDVFAKDSFWKDVESFINSPRGFLLVFHSRSREALARSLKEEGPSSLKPLDESKTLELVSLLISEKKWIKENPSNPLPFRVMKFTENGSAASGGLRSIFVNMSKKLPSERLESQVIADCRKLVKKLAKEKPGGYNMGILKREFSKSFGYKLHHRNLGYSKLQSFIESLIETMPEVRIETGYIVPSPSPVSYNDESFEEIGPVVREFEPLDEEDSNSKMEEEGGLVKQRKKGDETESDLLRLLSSWDDVEDDEEEKKPDYVVRKEKLVDGILTTLAKKPLGETRIQ